MNNCSVPAVEISGNSIYRGSKMSVNVGILGTPTVIPGDKEITSIMLIVVTFRLSGFLCMFNTGATEISRFFD
ncbi:MAG: hypothetical protein Q4Q00_10815 [Turicibacter sp.]|nr:hypothetical protein [Turicibacter sp.]